MKIRRKKGRIGEEEKNERSKIGGTRKRETWKSN
jgi:hypothetical protein